MLVVWVGLVFGLVVGVSGGGGVVVSGLGGYGLVTIGGRVCWGVGVSLDRGHGVP